MHPAHQGSFAPRGPGQFGPQHGQWVHFDRILLQCL